MQKGMISKELDKKTTELKTYKITRYPSGIKRKVCISCGKTVGALSGNCTNPNCVLNKYWKRSWKICKKEW